MNRASVVLVEHNTQVDFPCLVDAQNTREKFLPSTGGISTFLLRFRENAALLDPFLCLFAEHLDLFFHVGNF